MTDAERRTIWARIHALEGEMTALKVAVGEPLVPYKEALKFDYGEGCGVYSPSKLQDAAGALGAGMAWSQTPEGDAFWRRVQDRLVVLGSGTRPQTKMDIAK